MLRIIVAAALMLIGVLLANSASTSAEGSYRVPREKVLAVGMSTEDVTPPYKSGPYSRTNGVVWEQTIPATPSTANGLRARVRVDHAPAGLVWRVRILDAGRQTVEVVESNSTWATVGNFWTSMVPGAQLILQLESDADPTGLVVSIDALAYRTSKAVAQGTVGQDNKVAISQASSVVQRWGKPIARLTIMTSLGGAYCTGFLLSKELLMTNEHCIRTTEEALTTIAEFAYDSNWSKPPSYRVKSLETVDQGLDYAIVRLAKDPGTKFGSAALDGHDPIVQDKALVIIQHPGGLPKMVSELGCKVSGNPRDGVGDKPTDFGHLCDTLGGSSGSPVLDKTSGRVIGLHHLGYPEGMEEPENQGVRMGEILADIKNEKPTLYEEIKAAVHGADQ